MNIDPLAHWYRWLEYAAFGRALERCRFAYLNRLADLQSILILGEGDGRALERMLDISLAARIDVVEVSSRMIGLAQRRIAGSTRVRFIQEDASSIRFQPLTYDAIVTCFFLDCFSEPEACELIERLSQALIPNGIWLMSDFAIPALGWRHWHAKFWITAMYGLFWLTTDLRVGSLPPIAALLSRAGLTRLRRREQRAGMVVPEVWTKTGS